MADDAQLYIDAGDAKIRYRVDGPATAPVVVLSSSLGADASMWEPQLSALTARYRVLRYDMRGHGASSVTPGPYTIAQLGRDVVALLDALGVDRAHFCGISMGGIIGMWLAVNAAARFDRLALCNTAAQIGPRETFDARIAKVGAGGMTVISAAVIERWFTPAFRAREPQSVATIQTMFERTPPAGYAACCAAVRDADLRADLASIRAPTLVIAGKHDLATPPALGRAVAAGIPTARYVELDAPHLSNVEAAAGFNETLLGFLAA